MGREREEVRGWEETREEGREGRRSKEVRERWGKAGRITNRYGYIIPVREENKKKRGKTKKNNNEG